MQDHNQGEPGTMHRSHGWNLVVKLPSADTALSWLDKIALIAHEANRLWQVLHGDPAASPTFLDAPAWQRESGVDGIRKIANGEVTSPKQAHDSWLKFKADDGWTYGEVKDGEAKTHPCFVPYNKLPPEQRAKDALYFGIVRGLVAAHTEGAF